MTRGTRPRRRVRTDLWAIAAGLCVLAVIAPFAFLVAAAWPGSPDLWTHLAVHVLPGAIADTALLLAGVGILTAALGTSLAWTVATLHFPGRRFADAALLLPLAVPTYIVAYAYLDILHPVGPVQETIRAWLGYQSPREFRLPDVRSLTGCVVLLSFVLYPYVYLPVRALFSLQSANLVDAGRTLGLTRTQVFFRVALPLARPAVALGLGLALMETLNDIGASEFLGVRTLTVSIYSTWTTRGDLPGAAQIALGLLSLVVTLVFLERWARRRQRYVNDAQSPRPLVRATVAPLPGLLILAAVLVPVVIGFAAPAWYLLDAAAGRVAGAGVPIELLRALRATVLLSALATVASLAIGVGVAAAVRRIGGLRGAAVLTAASIGYATPGTVVAIAILPLVTGLDRLIDPLVAAVAGGSSGLLLLGSGAAILYAYGVRFLAITAGGAEAALAKIPSSIDDAAATLGAGARERLWRIQLPLLRPALAAAALLMFVDCMKELPATLLLRPLGVETLATLLYGEAARGTYEHGALAALLIVAAGLLPVALLSRMGVDAVAGQQLR